MTRLVFIFSKYQIAEYLSRVDRISVLGYEEIENIVKFFRGVITHSSYLPIKEAQ